MKPIQETQVIQAPATIVEHFAQLPDPRKGTLRYHKLIDILVIAICAVICGADDYEAIAAFGQAKVKWFETFLELPNGIPSHDTFWRVFEALDPEQFQQRFLSWMAAVRANIGREVIALDGKRLRHSYANESVEAMDLRILLSCVTLPSIY